MPKGYDIVSRDSQLNLELKKIDELLVDDVINLDSNFIKNWEAETGHTFYPRYENGVKVMMEPYERLY